MNFSQAIKTCFKKYAVCSGRASRSEFWWWMLFTFLAKIIIQTIDIVLFEKISPLSIIFHLAVFIPTIAVIARRLQDINLKQWWWLISFTIIGIIPLLYWFCKKGTEGDNRFGADPLQQNITA
jgi:uncharacterized membrane protein YhaH (DUF805 family)